jgi:predicted permease
MHGFWQDIRVAARALRKHRGFTTASVLTLALGIGATGAMFSVVYGVLLKPLPFHEPNGLVSLMHRGARADFQTLNHGPATYFAALDNQRVFEGIGGWDRTEVSVTSPGEPERVEGLAVTPGLLPVLGVQPLLGHFFTSDDELATAPRRVVLAHGYWQRRFGGDRNVIGRSLLIDGSSVEVIGVLPEDFMFLRQRPAILMPLRPDRAATGIQFGFQALARMKPGVTVAQANADMARWITLLPPVFERLGMTPFVRPLAEEVIGEVRDILWIVFASVGVVLLIACANVANLFLVRAEARHHELAMRAALGASRGRIARTLLAESLLLALAGGVLALLLARGALNVLRRIAPAELPRLDEIGMDGTVILFTLGLALLSAGALTLVGLLRFRTVGTIALKDAVRSAAATRRRHARHALVITQVALALTLMIVSGLMLRTFAALLQVHPGYVRPEEVLTFRVAIPQGLIADDQAAARTFESISERVARVPGVTSVGLTSAITMDGEDNGNPFYVEDVPRTDPPMRRYRTVAPGYVETMGNRMVAGRPVTWSEIHERRPVIMISEALAREYWSDPSDAIGRRVRGSDLNSWREVVGVVGDERDDGLSRPATPIVYWPMLDENYRWRRMAFVARSTRARTSQFVREIQQAVWSVNASLPLAQIETLDEIEARAMSRTSFVMVMIGIAASVALLLGVVGLYGVIAYAAAQRTRETGIRLALGAQVGHVRRMFLRQGLTLTTVGIAIGVVLALTVSRVMSALLFGVGNVDVVTYATMSLVLFGVALLATYLPARRASRVDPLIALRGET